MSSTSLFRMISLLSICVLLGCGGEAVEPGVIPESAPAPEIKTLLNNLENGSHDAKQWAIASLAMMGDRAKEGGAIEALTKIRDNDPDPVMKEKAAAAIAKLDGTATTDDADENTEETTE